MSVTANQIEEGEIDLKALAEKLSARRWWIVGAVLGFAALFIALAFLLTPIYRASTVMIPASADRSSLSSSIGGSLGELGGLAALAGVTLGTGDTTTEEAMAVLKSRQFTEKFIADKNLAPKLFASKWDAQAGKWKVSGKKQPTAAKAYKYFNKKVRRVVQDKKTGMVTVHIDWKDRNEAAAWANELVQRINAEMRRRAIDSATRSLGFLERELQTTSAVETRQAINRLIETQIKQRMLANVSEEYAFRVVDQALAPDEDDIFSPQRLLLGIAGPLLGLIFGTVLALLVPYRRP